MQDRFLVSCGSIFVRSSFQVSKVLTRANKEHLAVCKNKKEIRKLKAGKIVWFGGRPATNVSTPSFVEIHKVLEIKAKERLKPSKPATFAFC